MGNFQITIFQTVFNQDVDVGHDETGFNAAYHTDQDQSASGCLIGCLWDNFGKELPHNLKCKQTAVNNVNKQQKKVNKELTWKEFLSNSLDLTSIPINSSRPAKSPMLAPDTKAQRLRTNSTLLTLEPLKADSM